MIVEPFGAAQFQTDMQDQRSPHSILMAHTFDRPYNCLTTCSGHHHHFRVEDWHQNMERQGIFADLTGVPIVKINGNQFSLLT